MQYLLGIDLGRLVLLRRRRRRERLRAWICAELRRLADRRSLRSASLNPFPSLLRTPRGGANDASVKPDVGSGGSRPDDASVANDGGRETGPLGCDAGAFPTFESGCADTINCSFGLHQINCCGTLVAIGFNHAFRDAFDKAEAAWRQACPAACGCIAGPTRADDGKSGAAQDVAVSCVSRGPGSGRCVTYFP